jgi:hypothetical protein
MDAFGWTWEYIDEEMTLPRYLAICKQWRRVPRLSVSVAIIARGLGFLDAPPKEEGESLEDKKQKFESLANMFGGLGLKQQKEPEWIKTIK